MDKFYYLIIVILVLTPSFDEQITLNNHNITVYRYSFMRKFLIGLVFASQLIVSGFRSGFIDTAAYRIMFNNTGTDIVYALEQTDRGFFLFMALLNHISDNSQIMIFTSALITILLIFITLQKYSPDLKISLYLFLTGGYFAVSMNGVRQFMAVAILFSALPLIINKNYKTLFIIILIATMFHSSAVIFMLVYFFANARIFSLRYFIVSIVVIVSTLTIGTVAPWVFSLLEGSHYTVYLGDVTSGGLGAGLIRVLVEILPPMLAYFFYRVSEDKEFLTNRLLQISINLSLLNALFFILSLQAWIFARIGLYFQIYNLLLIPLLIKTCLNKQEKMLANFIIYIFFAVYFVFQMRVAYEVIEFPLVFDLF